MLRTSLERAAKKRTDYRLLANRGRIDYSMHFNSAPRRKIVKAKVTKQSFAEPQTAANDAEKRAETSVLSAIDDENGARTQPSPSAAVAETDAAQSPRANVFDNSTVVERTSNVIWQYEHNGWHDYDTTASDVVEAAFQDWQGNPYTDVRAIKSGQWQYQVDFNAMQQTNIEHVNHTRRSIRRLIRLKVVIQ